ncbi:MAG: hypothetical protein ACTS2F_21975 [Thainema sp.]
MKKLINSTLLLNLGLTIAAIALVILNYTHPSFIVYLTDEDGWFEGGSAVLYGFAAIACLMGLRQPRSPRSLWRVWCLLFATLFLVVAGEEISWGQRIWGIATPSSLESVNVQQELNFHNIDGIHQHIRLLAVLFIGIVCIAIPLWAQINLAFRQLLERFAVPVFPIYYSSLIVIALLFMVVPRLISGRESFAMDEISELYLSIAFCLFAITQFARPQPVSIPPQSSSVFSSLK